MMNLQSKVPPSCPALGLEQGSKGCISGVTFPYACGEAFPCQELVSAAPELGLLGEEQ